MPLNDNQYDPKLKCLQGSSLRDTVAGRASFAFTAGFTKIMDHNNQHQGALFSGSSP